MSHTFGAALEALKVGSIAQRAGWNGKGMYLVLVHGHVPADGTAEPFRASPDWKLDVDPDSGVALVDRDYEGEALPLRSFIAMRTADATLVPWLASQSDMLAEDWTISEPARRG